jgi:hypothetical protein
MIKLFYSLLQNILLSKLINLYELKIKYLLCIGVLLQITFDSHFLLAQLCENSHTLATFPDAVCVILQSYDTYAEHSCHQVLCKFRQYTNTHTQCLSNRFHSRQYENIQKTHAYHIHVRQMWFTKSETQIMKQRLNFVN